MKKIKFIIFILTIILFISVTVSVVMAEGEGEGDSGGTGGPPGSAPGIGPGGGVGGTPGIGGIGGSAQGGTGSSSGSGSGAGDSGSSGSEGSCFLSNTQITMSDETTKSIEDIQVGEKVMGYDIEKGEYTKNTVLEIEAPVRSSWFMIVIEDGTVLRTTNDHPIYVEKSLSAEEVGNNYKGWVSINPQATYINSGGMRVKKLEENDHVKTQNNQLFKILSIINIPQEIQTYNLKKVTNNNTFFAEGVLVHNKNYQGSVPFCVGRDCEDMGINSFIYVSNNSVVLSNAVNVCVSNVGAVCQGLENACGETNTGTVLCNGTCSASIPANPDYYGVACVSEENSCFIVGHGTIDCDNECNATVPSVDVCPNPIIPSSTTDEGEDTNIGFRTSDNSYWVVKDKTKILVWDNIENATTCTVSGPDDFTYTESYTEEESTSGTISGSTETPPIDRQSQFTLTCSNGEGSDASTTSSSLIIRLIPKFEEI